MKESSFHMIVNTLDLSNIMVLCTSCIKITGNFSFLARLVSLERLNICICGSIPAFLDALSRLQGLRELNPSCSDFSKFSNLTFIAKLPLLEKLYLSSCWLTSASLNTLLGIETHNNLSELDLRSNTFSGSLDPAFVARFPSLESVSGGDAEN